MRSLAITCPAAQRDTLNAALEAEGYGPGNLSVPMRNGERLIPDENGDLPNTPTHFSSHWWVTEAEYAHLQSLRDTALAGAAFNAQTDLTDPQGIFNATNGDYVRIVHKQFPNDQWGWRAEFVVQADEFSPGVRAIAIYADAEHQQYSYTTGAFTLGGDTYATEWNDDKSEPEAVHWALIFASAGQVEHADTLEADESEDIGWLRIGVPGDAVPPEEGTPEWQTGVSYSIGDRVMYQGTEYECIQAHTSQAGWNPAAVPALWEVI